MMFLFTCMHRLDITQSHSMPELWHRITVVFFSVCNVGCFEE